MGGVWLRAGAGESRDQWLALLTSLGARMQRMPFNVEHSRLVPSLDLDATLRSGRVIEEPGILERCDGGLVLIGMAERMTAASAAPFAAVLDTGFVSRARDDAGLSARRARLGVIALDESIREDERLPHALADRLGLVVDLRAMDARAPIEPAHTAAQIDAARRDYDQVTCGDAELEALCATALALGVDSPRISMLAFRAACAAAALAERIQVSHDELTLALSLVCAPRATRVPVDETNRASEQDPLPQESREHEAARARQPNDEPVEQPSITPREMQEVLVAAAAAAIPARLLDSLRASPSSSAPRRSAGAGRSARMRAGGKGRPAGTKPGKPHDNARLSVIETLRAAAPWQRLRVHNASSPGNARIRILPQDFRVHRSKPRTQTVTIFAVDASGSSALHRLAEAKGAVELLLSDCYVRRDSVAVVAFRGQEASVLLPPSRSLVRAKRSLAGLPGGGGTPLALGIAAAVELARLAQRRGDQPTIVLLSDGRANVAEDGAPGRERAQREAEKRAQTLASLRISALFIDISPRPGSQAGELARAMRARYVPLPFADARAVADAVKQLPG